MPKEKKTKHKDATDEKEQRAREAENRLKDLENTVNILQDEIKRLNDDMLLKERYLKKVNSELSQKLSSAQAETRKKDQLLNETKKQLEKNVCNKEDLEREKDSHVRKLAGAQSQIRDLELALKNAQKKIGQLTTPAEARQKEWENKVNILEENIKGLKVQMDSEEQKFKKEQDDLLMKLSHFEKQLIEKDKHLQETSKVIESLEHENMELKDLLKQQKELTSHAEARQKKLENVIRSSQQDIKQLQDEIVVRQQAFENEKRILKEEVSSAQEQAQVKERQLIENEEALEILIKQSEAQQEVLNDTVSIVQQENQRLQDEIFYKEERFKNENDNLMQKLFEMDEKIREAHQFIKQAESELETERALTRELQEKLRESQSSCKTLTETVEFLECQATMLQNQVKSLDKVDENCRLLVEKNAEIEQEKMCLNEEMGKISSGYRMLLYREGERQGVVTRGSNTVWQLRMELGAAKERIKRIQEENRHLKMTIEGFRHDDLIY